MNKEEPYRDHAERLRQRIEKINEKTPEVREQLPPREQLHREKRKKTKVKLKYPIIRLLVLFFILMPVVIFSIYSYLEGGKIKSVEKVSGESSGYEIINLDKTKTEDNTEKPVKEKEDSEVQDVQQSEEAEMSVEKANEEGVIQGEPDTGKNSVTPSDTTEKTTSTENTANNSNLIYHTVKSGENLYRIALKYYKSKEGEDIIRKANNIQGDEIYQGQVLEIPLTK